MLILPLFLSDLEGCPCAVSGLFELDEALCALLACFLLLDALFV